MPKRCSVLTGDADTEQHDPLLESKLRLLELQLREKDFEVQSANTSLAGAMETVESARGIRALNEKIEDLESAERKLKAEVSYSRVSCASFETQSYSQYALINFAACRPDRVVQARVCP